MGVAVQSGHGCCEARQREHALIMLCNVQLLRERMMLSWDMHPTHSCA